MDRTKIIVALLFGIMFIYSCKDEKKTGSESNISIEQAITPVEELREIFYNMYLPDEMTRLFERVGANFNPSIINSPENYSRYLEEKSIAVALGIYGVDLGYSRIFDQTAITANYLTIIRLLTEKIGIPKNHFDDIYQRIEDNIENQDSVAKITTDLYTRTDHFLKGNNKDSYAALIVMGGWIEALYIASKILETNPQNVEIMDRIAEQKYSLNSLISLLNNYQDDIFIAEKILLLKKLKKIFDKFEIYYSENDIDIDTVNKTIKTKNYTSGITQEITVEINHVTTDIRRSFIR